MIIRKTRPEDLEAVMQIYKDGQIQMRESGNLEQWGDVHPPRALIENDIQIGKSYVCENIGNISNVSDTNGNDGSNLLAVFYFSIEEDPTYQKIDGKWLNNEPYGVVHRIARKRDASAKGSGAFCINWCYEQYSNIRIDTHKDNTPMLVLLERLGFKRCGIIWIANGDERVAFQKL